MQQVQRYDSDNEGRAPSSALISLSLSDIEIKNPAKGARCRIAIHLQSSEQRYTFDDRRLPIPWPLDSYEWLRDRAEFWLKLLNLLLAGYRTGLQSQWFVDQSRQLQYLTGSTVKPVGWPVEPGKQRKADGDYVAPPAQSVIPANELQAGRPYRRVITRVDLQLGGALIHLAQSPDFDLASHQCSTGVVLDLGDPSFQLSWMAREILHGRWPCLKLVPKLVADGPVYTRDYQHLPKLSAIPIRAQKLKKASKGSK